MKRAIIVSNEMTTLIGRGPASQTCLPTDAGMFLFKGICEGRTPFLSYVDQADAKAINDVTLVFVVRRDACRRLFPVQASSTQTWYMPSTLKALALGIVECDVPAQTRDTLRLARSIELLCQVHCALADGSLLPKTSEGSFTERDLAAIVAAHSVLEERWQEKLTIPGLASLVGINRDKLVRGFRQMFGASFSEILAERRLTEARRMLLASDLPVATVGHRCSYLSNASFTRAFTRRYGVAPTQLRRMGVAA